MCKFRHPTHTERVALACLIRHTSGMLLKYAVEAQLWNFEQFAYDKLINTYKVCTRIERMPYEQYPICNIHTSILSIFPDITHTHTHTKGYLSFLLHPVPTLISSCPSFQRALLMPSPSWSSYFTNSGVKALQIHLQNREKKYLSGGVIQNSVPWSGHNLIRPLCISNEYLFITR